MNFPSGWMAFYIPQFWPMHLPFGIGDARVIKKKA
jgi:hypothetical protein